MKEIKAIIKPFVLDKVLSALNEKGSLPGVTISAVEGWGHLPEPDTEGEAAQARHGFSKKAKVEIVVNDDQAEQVVNLITTAAHTGNPGDGKIFVYDVVQVIRIRTGERGSAAI